MSYTMDALMRADSEQGKGASRRLRRNNQVPAIIYGGDAEPKAIKLYHNQIVRNLMEAAFYEQVITLTLEDGEEKVILQDLQRHPYKPLILHADFIRATAEEIAEAEAAAKAEAEAKADDAAEEKTDEA